MNVQLKLDNARLEGGKFLIDLFGNPSENMKVFGTNLRLLYDQGVFKAGHAGTVRAYRDGYRSYNFHFGNSPIGWKFFDGVTAKPSTYINGAVELQDRSKAVELVAGSWTPFITIELTPKEGANIEGYIPFILDKKIDATKDGFFNSAGITITRYVGQENGIDKTAPTLEYVEHINFIQSPGATKTPWGSFTQQTFFQLV